MPLQFQQSTLDCNGEMQELMGLLGADPASWGKMPCCSARGEDDTAHP